MLLAIDIGNTNIHFGLHDGAGWRATWRARTIHEKMSDEYGVLLRSFFEDRGFSFNQVSAVVFASVVPDLTGTFDEVCRTYLDLTPLIIGLDVKTGVSIQVDNPHEVGPDRIVNAAAARALFGGPAVVIDFGTATTWDVIDAAGAYIGGVIAPGIGLAHDALVSRAARLHQVEIAPPPAAIGRNTVHAMQSGLFLGYISLIEGLVNRIRAELAPEPAKVIATGGLAALFADHTPIIDHIAPNLTLDGLRIIWQINQPEGENA